MFNIIKYSKYWISISLLLLILSWLSFFLNLNLSKDFVWWIEWISKVKPFLSWMNINIQKIDNGWYFSIKTKDVDKVKKELESNIWKENIINLSVVWPTWWEYIKDSTVKALIIWFFLMVIYILFVFINLKDYISPFVLSLIVIFTMIFDISIPAWVYWLLMFFDKSITVDVVFVIAILTIMWYSINDTIVIFDRIRENLSNLNINKKDKDFNIIYEKVFEKSLWSTMNRSIWTSLTTLFFSVLLYIFWTTSIKTFAFLISIWVIAGTFSSIFLAATLAYLISKN